jgi:hypothetical protein
MIADDCDPPLGFELWVKVSAQSLNRDPDERARLRDRCGIDDEHWLAADAYWTSALVADLQGGDHARPRYYGRRCAEELRARRTQQTAFVHSTSGAPAVPEDAEDVSQTVSLEDAGGPAAAPMQQTMDAVPVRGPVLPFRSEAANGFLDRLPRSPPIDSASTNDTLTPALPRAPVAALPFVPTSPLPELTVEQFAALNAELRARRQHESETLRRFGVAGRDARHQLEQQWAARFAADAVLEQRYRSVLAACSSWLDSPRS